MAALKSIAAPTATVLRDGMQATIPSSELVPGDMVLLEAGRLVPADLRITESAQMRVDESMLTGESLPVDKTTASIADAEASVGDRKNMAFKGTVVTYGRGSGVVVATGMQTMSRMKVEMLWHDGDDLPVLQPAADAYREAADPQMQFWLALALSNDAETGADGELLGDPTETALLEAAEGAGFAKQRLQELCCRGAV